MGKGGASRPDPKMTPEENRYHEVDIIRESIKRVAEQSMPVTDFATLERFKQDLYTIQILIKRSGLID